MPKKERFLNLKDELSILRTEMKESIDELKELTNVIKPQRIKPLRRLIRRRISGRFRLFKNREDKQKTS